MPKEKPTMIDDREDLLKKSDRELLVEILIEARETNHLLGTIMAFTGNTSLSLAKIETLGLRIEPESGLKQIAGDMHHLRRHLAGPLPSDHEEHA